MENSDFFIISSYLDKFSLHNYYLLQIKLGKKRLFMNKSEILEKSRMENKGKDMVDEETSVNGINKGWIVTVFLTLIFTIADGIIFSRFPFEMLSAVLAGLAVVFFTKYNKLRKRHELVIAVMYGFASLLFFASWLIMAIRK